MNLPFWNKKIGLFHAFMLICCVCLANDDLFKQARTLQREGKHGEAIEAFKNYLTQPMTEREFSDEQLVRYTDALVQLMNTFQSKGAPEECVSTLKNLFVVLTK